MANAQTQLDDRLQGILLTEMSSIDGERRSVPLQERLIHIASKEQISHQELQNYLVHVATIAANVPEANVAEHLLPATNALSALSYFGSMGVVPELIDIATKSRLAFRVPAMRAALYTTVRENADLLPDVVHAIQRSDESADVYTILAFVLENMLPEKPEQRAELEATILELFMEGYRNRNYPDRVFLDETLAKRDEAFRQSAERQETLTELSRSDNPVVNSYARMRLKEVFGASLPAGGLSTPASVVPVATVARPASTAVNTTMDARRGVQPPGSLSIMSMRLGVIVVVLVLVTLGLWFLKKR